MDCKISYSIIHGPSPGESPRYHCSRVEAAWQRAAAWLFLEVLDTMSSPRAKDPHIFCVAAFGDRFIEREPLHAHHNRARPQDYRTNPNRLLRAEESFTV